MNNASKKLQGLKIIEKKSAGKEAVMLKMSHEHKIAHMANIAFYDPATEN